LLDDRYEGAKQVFLKRSCWTARQLRTLGDSQLLSWRATRMSRGRRGPVLHAEHATDVQRGLLDA
jgi:hypothetical protein